MFVRNITVLSFPNSKDCGVKFDRATKKRRRFEELDDENLNIMGSPASHCTTCTCCRPSKRLKMKSMDTEQQCAVLRNVRWALDEDKQPSPIPKKLLQPVLRVCDRYLELTRHAERTRQKKLLQQLSYVPLPSSIRSHLFSL
jgi:hypothetical protein